MNLLVAQEERDMIYPGRNVVHVCDVFTEALRQVSGGVLDAMAQTHTSDFRGYFLDRPAIDGHGIYVLHQDCLRADLLHVTANYFQHWYSAQPPEDATNSK